MLTGELPFRGSPSMLRNKSAQPNTSWLRRFRGDVPRTGNDLFEMFGKYPARRDATGRGPGRRSESFRARRTDSCVDLWGMLSVHGGGVVAICAVTGLAAAVLFTLLVARPWPLFRRASQCGPLGGDTGQSQGRASAGIGSSQRVQTPSWRCVTQLALHVPREAFGLLHDPQRCPEQLRDFTWHYLAGITHRGHRVLRGHTSQVNSVVFSPHGTLLASASDDGTIRLWRTSDWSLQLVLSGHKGPVDSVAFLPAGNVLFSAGKDWTVRRWDLETGDSEVFARDVAAIKFLAASPDGKLLAWATSGMLFWGDGDASSHHALRRRDRRDTQATGRSHRHDRRTALFARLEVPGLRCLQTRSHHSRMGRVERRCLGISQACDGAIGGLALMPDRENSHFGSRASPFLGVSLPEAEVRFCQQSVERDHFPGGRV